MKENVGRTDRIMRFVAGPTILGLGYLSLGGNRGKLPGLATMVLGTLVIESAITKVCPVSHAFGIDTRSGSGGWRRLLLAGPD